MILQMPDGKLEIDMSSCCCPPGPTRPGMHTNSCTSWVRLQYVEQDDWGPWIRVGRGGTAYIRRAAGEEGLLRDLERRLRVEGRVS